MLSDATAIFQANILMQVPPYRLNVVFDTYFISVSLRFQKRPSGRGYKTRFQDGSIKYIDELDLLACDGGLAALHSFTTKRPSTKRKRLSVKETKNSIGKPNEPLSLKEGPQIGDRIGVYFS